MGRLNDILKTQWGAWLHADRGGAFREEIRDTFLGATRSPVKPDDVRGTQFSSTEYGYDKKQVAAFLDAAGIRLAAMESTDRPAGPLVSGAILAAWAEWADSTRFSTRRLRKGYDTAQVDAFLDAIRDKFLGVRRPPLTWPAARGKQFPTHRPGYDVEEVDAFLDKAEPRLAAMPATDRGDMTDDAPAGLARLSCSRAAPNR